MLTQQQQQQQQVPYHHALAQGPQTPGGLDPSVQQTFGGPSHPIAAHQKQQQAQLGVIPNSTAATAPPLLPMKQESSSIYNQSSPQRPSQNNVISQAPQASQMRVHETFTVSNLERKMMFLNEPSLQVERPNQAVDQIRQVWRVHHRQMLNMKADAHKTDKKSALSRPESIEEVGGTLAFSSATQRPRDFNSFQNSVRSQLAELEGAHKDLRHRFKAAGVEVDKDIERIEQLTGHIQQVFNDFIVSFNSFVQREERLETLHHQAIKKSKELNKKIQLEVMAQSSQRSQLLAIVDDLTGQLRQTKATTVSIDSYKKEHQAHGATQQVVEDKDKEIEQHKKEIQSLVASLQTFGQAGIAHKSLKQDLDQQISQLNNVIEGQKLQIEDLITRRSQLEQEVSRLKSQIELTQSSKDKIILKLKQEMRMQAQQHQNSSTLNGTQPLNTSSFIGANPTSFGQANNASGLYGAATGAQQTSPQHAKKATSGFQPQFIKRSNQQQQPRAANTNHPLTSQFSSSGNNGATKQP